MAKKKSESPKSESTEKSAPKKAPAKSGPGKSAPGKSAPAKKVAAKKQAAPTADPMVNTTLAAQNAAKHLAAGLPRKAGSTGAMQPESSTFKNLKQGLAKPHLTGLD